MKIKLWIKYNEGYLPTKRHRKLRYREIEEYIEVEVKEISIESLVQAFDIGHVIYSYDNRLWRKAVERDIHCGIEEKPMTALEALKYASVTYSTYFGKYKSLDESTREKKEDIIKRAEVDMNNYLIVDGELYTVTSEPMYCIYTFGLGHNHAGIGTSLSINNRYNCNISKERYFNALEYEKAVAKALEIAERRGDTKSFDYIKNREPIKVFDKKFVTRNPQLEHGNGNGFINSLEDIINNTDSSIEAGIITMAVALNEIS